MRKKVKEIASEKQAELTERINTDINLFSIFRAQYATL